MNTETDPPADRPAGQPIGAPTPPTDRPEIRTVATNDEPLRVPSWMREPEVHQPLGFGDRARLTWERVGGGLLTVVGIALAVGLVGVLGWAATEGWPNYAASRQPDPTNEVVPTSAVGFGGQTGFFAGTPAESFAEGEAAIVLPAATPQPPFTTRQVGDGLAKVRQALILGRLDTAMQHGDPDRFLALFAEDARSELRRDFQTGQFASYATRFRPHALRASVEARAKGRITYRATRAGNGIRVLEVTTNFVWVYPFRVPNVSPGDALVVIHDEVVWQVPHPDDVRPSSAGLWLASSQSYASNIDCASLAEGLIDVSSRLKFDLRPGTAGDDPDPDRMYDPDQSLDLPGTC